MPASRTLYVSSGGPCLARIHRSYSQKTPQATLNLACFGTHFYEIHTERQGRLPRIGLGPAPIRTHHHL